MRSRERAIRILQKLNRDDIRSGSYREAVGAEVVLPAMFLRDGSLDALEAFPDRSFLVPSVISEEVRERDLSSSLYLPIAPNTRRHTDMPLKGSIKSGF
jgi:hypothetical protein